MKKLLTTILLIFVSTIAAFAQNGEAEREILKIHKGLDEAFLKNDVAYFERYFAPEYIYSNNFGKLISREGNLEYYRSLGTKPTFKVLANKTDDVKIRVTGNAALVTASWTTTVLPIGDPNAESHTDTGRYTGVYERRGGKWLVVAEHNSELNHDPKLMEQQVLKAGRRFNELMKRLKSGRAYAELVKDGEIAEFDRILADEYMYTSRDGEISTKAEDLESYKTNKIKLESVDILEQKVRVIGNYTAVETGLIRYKGANNGKPFDITKRFTTTWFWRDFRWQIVADHTSAVK
jgi:hypothetical protein